MYNLLPKPVMIKVMDEEAINFDKICFLNLDGTSIKKSVVKNKFESLEGLDIYLQDIDVSSISSKVDSKALEVMVQQDPSFVKDNLLEYQKNDAYFLRVYMDNERNKGLIDIKYVHEKGLLNAFSTLKQLIRPTSNGFTIPRVEIYDFPNVEIRSISTTFAWYAGYSRVGFDSQLWNYEDWKAFIDVCSDFKINQINMCMYGYWPFKFDEFPETTLTNYPLKVWSKENKTWIEISYTHPNIVNEFLPDLINYAHEHFIRIFAYIGLNSYNGGYSNVYKERRAVPPSEKYYNNFDFLCLSDERNVDYLKKSIRRIVEIGFDGIIFEESEENYWYCSCEKCKKRYLEKTSRPADAKHLANYELLRKLHSVIKETNPSCEVGLRAWREEPVEKEVVYMENAKNSIPEDVFLYWAPGPYNPESEFEKWVKIFGPERICARDQEANAYSASMGRLFYMFRSNILRPDKEHLYWSLENDIEQYLGSVRNGCKGINGYVFEWYAYFLHLYAVSQYGWNANVPKEEFPYYALQSIFGEELAKDILYIYENIKIIHETQLPICKLFFPFLRYKVRREDLDLLRKIKGENRKINVMIDSLLDRIRKDKFLRQYELHFEKLKNMASRNEIILDMCFVSIEYESAESEEQKIILLKKLYELNEKDFDLIKEMYFDVNPHEKSGIRVCGFPYHEIKRSINNILEPDKYDPNTIYLGTETIGWLWL
ncbi:MAG: hypothetical protein H5T85_01730 [Actinobacteria bacterium]|nr:hypothetical protein [Actinomycetota bacterium]